MAVPKADAEQILILFGWLLNCHDLSSGMGLVVHAIITL